MSQITVSRLFQDHLVWIEKRIAHDRMAPRSIGDYKPLLKLIKAAGIDRVAVDTIKPIHFSELQNVIETGRTLRTQKNIIMSIRTVFNWGGPDGMQLYTEKVSFGPDFKPPTKKEVTRERHKVGKRRFFDSEIILSALSVCGTGMKVAILLGINCGFYPSDSVAITLDYLHLNDEIPYHDFPRVKTDFRRAAALWPETVEAIKYYLATRMTKDENEKYLLVTRYGHPYKKMWGAKKMIEAFNNVADHQEGVSLGSLRHTYATITGEHTDRTIRKLSMGHADVDLLGEFYEQFNINELPRLKSVADMARTWLFHK